MSLGKEDKEKKNNIFHSFISLKQYKLNINFNTIFHSKSQPIHYLICPLYKLYHPMKTHLDFASHVFGSLQIFHQELAFLNIFIQTSIFNTLASLITFFLLSSLNYYFFYVKYNSTFTPKRIQLIPYKEQKMYDIKLSLVNILLSPLLVTVVTMTYPFYSKIQYQWSVTPSLFLYMFLHFCFDQFFTYWLHRILHHPLLFKHLHLLHHKSTSTTPFSGFALHPIDGFIQSLPLFVSCFFIPLPYDFLVIYTVLSTLWVVSVHDNINLIPFRGILDATCHTIHHYPWGQNYNFGKTTSICDRIFGTYCNPDQLDGYGYAGNSSLKNFFSKANTLYEKIITDNGEEKIKKQTKKSLSEMVKRLE